MIDTSNEAASAAWVQTAGIVVAAGVAIDQTTKAITASMPCGRLICPLRNGELMLGVPAGGASTVVLASTVGLMLFSAWVRLARRWATIPGTPRGLVVAGIVSNLIDRLAAGSVRDFVVAPGNSVVNVADVLLAIGVVWCAALVVAARLSVLVGRSPERPLHSERR